MNRRGKGERPPDSGEAGDRCRRDRRRSVPGDGTARRHRPSRPRVRVSQCDSWLIPFWPGCLRRFGVLQSMDDRKVNCRSAA